MKTTVYRACPNCYVGGYEFCPTCLGSGGVIIEIESDNDLPPSVDDPKLKAIDNRMKIIAQKNCIGERYEQGLFKDLQYLCDCYQDEEITKRIRKILKVRKHIVNRRKVQKINLRFQRRRIAEFQFEKNKVILRRENKYFFIRKNKVYFKFTSSKCLDFGNHLEGLIRNLENNAFIKKNNDIYQNLESLTSEEIETSGINSTAIMVSENNEERVFIINIHVMKDVCKKFIVQLQLNDSIGWYYNKC